MAVEDVQEEQERMQVDLEMETQKEKELGGLEREKREDGAVLCIWLYEDDTRAKC